MTVRNWKFGVLLAGLTLLFLTGIDQVAGSGGDAEARVGRPLTPVSVAGTGRRTVRRCAAGVYNC